MRILSTPICMVYLIISDIPHSGKSLSKNSFRLPFSLSMLADYIATDRSAMMRELKKLKDEGFLTSDGRQIRLLQ